MRVKHLPRVGLACKTASDILVTLQSAHVNAVAPQDKNQALLARRQAAIPRGVTSATNVFAARAEGAVIWDSEERRYIDFMGGIGVLATGHRHPKVLAAVREQLERYTHTAFQAVPYDLYVRLAERLNALAPFKGPARTLLVTTGAEAVENAVKIARIATGRSAVIAFTGGFHGRTQLTSALTGKVSPYKRAVTASTSDIFRIPFPIAHRGVRVQDTVRAIEVLFYADIEPKRVAAIIIEPVQGEGGFHVAPPDLMLALRKICDDHGILLIADEVQAGFGRTGRLFAIEHSGIEPDLVTMAKSLAGGFPLAGVIGRADIMNSVEPGGLGGTYGGSPIGCAAALAVLDVIEDERLLERANHIGIAIRARLEAIAADERCVPIANIRGSGAMIGFDVVKKHAAAEPDGNGAKNATARALEHGLLLLTCGTYGETIRILCPLTIPDAQLHEGLTKLEQALRLPHGGRHR